MGVYKMLVLNCQKMLVLNCHFLLESTCRLQYSNLAAMYFVMKEISLLFRPSPAHV